MASPHRGSTTRGHVLLPAADSGIARATRLRTNGSVFGMSRTWAVIAVVAVAALFKVPTPAHAYIPALPVNDTSALDNSDDLLHLASYNGVFNTGISRQLWAEGFDDNGNYTNITTIVPWTKYSKGVLIHFDEGLRNQSPSAVPWIAMISCDTNGTSPSETDIFTIVRDLGAQAALLYSLHSEGCQINQEYLNSFEKVLDVFAATSLQGSRIIESQFTNVNMAACQYNSTTLNASYNAIETLLNSNPLSVRGNVPINSTSSLSADVATSVDVNASSTAPSVFDPNASDSAPGMSSDSAAPTDSSTSFPSLFSASIASPLMQPRQNTATSTSHATSTHSSATRTSSAAPAATTSNTIENYLGAVMAAANLTVGGLNSASPTATASSGNGGPNTSTSLAMIILYAITGVVTFLFLIVIMSGAIRAARHPERYGPRAAGGLHGSGGPGGAGQTRAAGLTRAILDTFPVVRFGGGAATAQTSRGDEEAGADGSDGQKKSEPGTPEAIELASLPTMVAVPTAVHTLGDGRDVVEEHEEVIADPARARSASRASTMGGDSFYSAESTPLQHQTSTTPLNASAGLATIPASPNLLESPPALTSSVPPSTRPTAAEEAAILASTDLPSSSESCPICLTEFEEGDELRILPCDERHRFHPECIDPFLLNVSRLCPLCRLDLGNVGGRESDEMGREEYARREEERVRRHLRSLLHRRGANGSSASEGAGGGSGPSAADEASGEGSTSTSTLRSRFAQYVVARRQRAFSGSGSGVGSGFVGLGRRRGSSSATARAPAVDG
ncbi:hypothetical protein NBRC10513v2_005806 [Rhodotorula toruloides]|nr:hypothetical protein AAT19DRAFT_14738 [Rhodotorula toruloides]